jgi:SAM-dependent methyltransferase
VIRKLQRVWPSYVRVWRERCGLEDLEGRTVWVHEPGWVPFAPLASFLLTGRGGIVTAAREGLSDRYVRAAARGVLAAGFEVAAPERRAAIAALQSEGVAEVLRVTGARVVTVRDPGRLPIAPGSVDLCHSGGVLEHQTPEALAAFLRASFVALRPGGIASHVYDHRDHLRHVDPGWPFLLHMALPGAAHRVCFGHPLLFHNRLAPAEVAALFEAAGFERIAHRRFVLPDKRYVDEGAAAAGEAGVPGWLRTGRLSRLTDEDRHTAAVHYLYRKPPA